jgi:hypothetical protein
MKCAPRCWMNLIFAGRTSARDIRRQLIEQGCSTAEALIAAEQARHIFRADAADQAPRVMDGMAASAAPTH